LHTRLELLLWVYLVQITTSAGVIGRNNYRTKNMHGRCGSTSTDNGGPTWPGSGQNIPFGASPLGRGAGKPAFPFGRPSRDNHLSTPLTRASGHARQLFYAMPEWVSSVASAGARAIGTSSAARNRAGRLLPPFL
jgi:hypothetical protein